MNILTHIEQLPLSKERESMEGLVAALRLQPDVEPAADLTARIMLSIEGEPRDKGSNVSRTRSLKPWFGAAAAAVAFIAFLILPRLYEGGGCNITREDWLAHCQEQDGSWNPARHNGSKAYQPALTALSALALHRSGARYESEVARARDYLISIQAPDGTFGGQGRESMYNQSIVTFMLAETGDNSGAALKKSVQVIQSRQSAVGGWDYVDGSEGNAAITSWHIQALAAVGRVGIVDGSVSMRKGLRWLRGLADERGRVAYHKGSPSGSDTINALAGYTLITAGAEFPGVSDLGRRVVAAMTSESVEAEGADLYRDCMKVRALTAAGKVKDAAALKNSVAALHTEIGLDQWEQVGGTLYVASMRSLAGSY